MLSVPQRLRYFMQRDGAVLNMVLRIFLWVIAQSLQRKSPGAANVDKATLHIGAIAFIHRFGSSLNGHVLESEPPHIAPARGPPLWEDFDAQVGEGSQIEPDWDIAAQPAGTCQ